jgi:hypothetical protein
MYDTSKEASNQQLFVRMLGSSIKLSLISKSDKQSTSKENPRVKNLVQIERNAIFDPFLTHAVHIQHVMLVNSQ